MQKELAAIKTGLFMAAAAPAVAAGAPVLNSILEGGRIGGVLPEGAIEKAKDFVGKVMDSPAMHQLEGVAKEALGGLSGLARSGSVGQLEGRIGSMIESLRGGLLSKTGSLSGLKVGAGEFGAELFPNGLSLPGVGGVSEGFAKIRNAAKAM